ncbi:uncharacterized protein LOC109832665 isoform X2 [Asparagus officinalis]|nr:uncharacterized protein LOC109832665 isoform X2 [Asparagus officinalis]
MRDFYDSKDILAKVSMIECLCSKNVQHVEFIGMKQSERVEHNSVSLSGVCISEKVESGISCSRVVQVSGGGWWHPNSYYLGNGPENQKCFAYLKSVAISEGEQAKGLHIQQHGGSTFCILHYIFGMQSIPMKDCYIWLATGCDDGTVRLQEALSLEGGANPNCLGSMSLDLP